MTFHDDPFFFIALAVAIITIPLSLWLVISHGINFYHLAVLVIGAS